MIPFKINQIEDFLLRSMTREIFAVARDGLTVANFVHAGKRYCVSFDKGEGYLQIAKMAREIGLHRGTMARAVESVKKTLTEWGCEMYTEQRSYGLYFKLLNTDTLYEKGHRNVHREVHRTNTERTPKGTATNKSISKEVKKVYFWKPEETKKELLKILKTETELIRFESYWMEPSTTGEPRYRGEGYFDPISRAKVWVPQGGNTKNSAFQGIKVMSKGGTIREVSDQEFDALKIKYKGDLRFDQGQGVYYIRG